MLHCDLCEYETPKKQFLQKHVASIHKEKPLKVAPWKKYLITESLLLLFLNRIDEQLAEQYYPCILPFFSWIGVCAKQAIPSDS